MKCLIVINSFSVSDSCLKKAIRLKEELASFSVETDIKEAIDLLVKTDGNNIDLNLSEYLFCFYLDKDAYLAKAISNKITMFNSYESLLLSDDKMQTLLALEGNGVFAPTTISAPLCYSDVIDEIKVSKFLLQVESTLGFPLVFKECHGSLGKQVKLIKDEKELKRVYLIYKKIPHLYEEYIYKKPASDYRLIVVGNKVIASMNRVNSDEFRSNIALGGKGYDTTGKLPTSFEEIAIKTAKLLKLDYAGIDIIERDGKPLVLEANGNAFFSEIEKVTKVNVAKALVTYVLTKLGIVR